MHITRATAAAAVASLVALMSSGCQLSGKPLGPLPSTTSAAAAPAGAGDAGTAAKLSLPRTTSASPPRAATGTFGPNGYDGIELQMTLAEAKAAGLTVLHATGADGCRSGMLPDFGIPAVIVSGDRGVVMISAPDASATTREGIHIGSTKEQVMAAYPDARREPDFWQAAVPGNRGAHYWFDLADGKVSGWTLEKAQDCVN